MTTCDLRTPPAVGRSRPVDGACAAAAVQLRGSCRLLMPRVPTFPHLVIALCSVSARFWSVGKGVTVGRGSLCAHSMCHNLLKGFQLPPLCPTVDKGLACDTASHTHTHRRVAAPVAWLVGGICRGVLGFQPFALMLSLGALLIWFPCMRVCTVFSCAVACCRLDGDVACETDAGAAMDAAVGLPLQGAAFQSSVPTLSSLLFLQSLLKAPTGVVFAAVLVL